MKKKKVDVWISQITASLKALRFSALPPSTQASVQREMFFFNNSRMPVIAIVILILEAINMANVLFFSRSGLATANNRLYFTMYLLLFGSALLCLSLRHLLGKRPQLLQQCYVGFTLVWVLWHGTLSSMDLRHNSNIVVFVTGILSMSLLVRLKPIQMLSILAGGFVWLLLCAWDSTHFSNGNLINACIVTVITMLIFSSRYCSMLEERGYRQKMILQENHRKAEKQRLSFLQDQQTALLHLSTQCLFLWDKQQDTLSFSSFFPIAPIAQGHNLVEGDRRKLLALLADQKGSCKAILTLQFQGDNAPSQFLLESIAQLDSDNILLGCAGKLMKKEGRF